MGLVDEKDYIMRLIMEEVIFGFRQLFENSGYGDLLYLMKVDERDIGN